MAVFTFLFFLLVLPGPVNEVDGISGIILDSTGAAIPRAKIEVYERGFSFIAYSDDSGAFSIEDASAGSYSLRVTADGFEPYTASIDVPSEPMNLMLRVASRSEAVI